MPTSYVRKLPTTGYWISFAISHVGLAMSLFEAVACLAPARIDRGTDRVVSLVRQRLPAARRRR
jgi:hypothetical protein